MDPTTRDEALELSQELMADIELSRLPIDQLVLKCTRLARIARDETASEWLSWERGTIPTGEQTKKWRMKTRRCFDDDSKNIYAGAIQIVPLINGWKSQLNQLRIPDVSGDWANAVVGNLIRQIDSLRNVIQQHEMILSVVNSEMHNFVVITHYSLKISERQDSMFNRASTEIETLLSHLGPQQIEKIDWAYTNLKAGDAESIAAAMNSVRRLIDEFADAVFPATETARTSTDGKPINLGKQNRLNRIKAYIDDRLISPTRKQRVKRSISDVYGRVCAGLHKEVTANEAEYLFLSTYAILGEILTLASDGALKPVDVDVA